MNSVKCSHCNLINFGDAELCKRCNNSLTELSAPEVTPQIPTEISIQPKPANVLKFVFPVVLLVLVTILGTGYFLYKKIENDRIAAETAIKNREIEEKTREQEERNKAIAEKKEAIAENNKKSIKAALNAVGEINSVASVGSNFVQFSETIQSAKIKFDAAVREIDSPSEDDQLTLKTLYASIAAYADAKDVWSEFVRDADSYGFLEARSYSKTERLSAVYKYEKRQYGYFRDSVLSSILE